MSGTSAMPRSGLDLKIIAKTVSFLLTGERSHAKIAETAESQESQDRAAHGA